MSKETNQLAGITQQLKTLIGAKNDNSQVVSAIDALRMTMQVNQMEKRETDKNAPTALAAAVAAKEGTSGGMSLDGGISDQLDFQRRFKAGRAGTFFDRYFLPSERRAQDEIDEAKRKPEGDTHVNAIVDFGECIRLCTDGGVQTLADEIIGVRESVVLLAGNTADFFKQWFAMMKVQLIDKEEQRREKTKRLKAPSMTIDGEVVDDDEDGPSITDGIAGLWAGSKILKVLKWAVIGLPVSIYKFFKAIGTKWFGKFTKTKMGLKYAKYLARPRVWPIIAGAMIAGYFWNGIKDIWSDGTGAGEPHADDVTGFDDPAEAEGAGKDGTDWINIAGNVSIGWMAANMAVRTTKGALLLKWAQKHWKLGSAIGAGARKATVGSFMWSALKMAGRATAVGIGALTPLGWAAIVGAAVSYYYWDEIQGLMKSAWENEFGVVDSPLHAETIFEGMIANSGYYARPNMEGPGGEHMMMLAKDSVMKRLAQFMGPKNKMNMNRAKQFMLSQGWSMDEINAMLTELSTSDDLFQGRIVKMRRDAGVTKSGIPLIDNAFVSRWNHLSGNKKAMGFLENIPKLISEKPLEEHAGSVIVIPNDSPLKGTLDINKINSDNTSTITVTNIGDGSSETITYQDESLDYNVPVVRKKRGFAPI